MPSPIVRTSYTGRADLLLWLAHMGEERLTPFAALLGFGKPEIAKEEKGRSRPPAGPEQATPREEGQPRDGAASPEGGEPQPLFWRVKSYRPREKDEVQYDEPAWFRESRVFRADDPALRADPVWRQEYTPLLPWAKLWPFLRQVLGRRRPGRRLDIPAAVRCLTTGKIPKKLPLLERMHWARDCQILLDVDPRLAPFHPDLRWLLGKVVELRGRAGLEALFLEDGPYSPVLAGFQQRRRRRPYRAPEPGTPILVLGDLGCLEKTAGKRTAWTHFGAYLVRRGFTPVALVPAPPRLWTEELGRSWRMAYWERASRPPRCRHGGASPGADIPAAENRLNAHQVLTALAFAIQVEPELVRAVRLLHPLECSDVALESEVWRHERVEHCPLAFFHRDDPLTVYRDDFRRLPESFRRQVFQLVAHHHRRYAPLVCIEEAYRFAVLNDSPDLPPEIDRHIETLIRTFAVETDIDRRAVRAWVDRLLRRIGQAAEFWESPLTRRITTLATLVHAERIERGEWAAPPGFDITAEPWILAQARRKRDWRLRQVGMNLNCIERDDDAAFSTAADRPGSPLGGVVAGAPIVQALPDWQSHSATLRLDSPWQFPAVVPPGRSIRLRSDCEEIELQAIPKPPWTTRIGRDKYGLYADFTVEGVCQRMRWIPPGRFLMGSPPDEPERGEDERQHTVVLTQGFWLADTACTQALWQAIMGENPSRFKGEKLPVETVNWDDVQEFLQRINTRKYGLDLHLPTEAEWEWACRAGTTTPFSFGQNITSLQVNYDVNYPYAGGKKGKYRKTTLPVGSLPANPWGLHEMHGNVWEWCADWYGKYPAGPVSDPMGPRQGSARVLRGGSWIHSGRNARSAFRIGNDPGSRYDSFGFRLARGHHRSEEQAGEGENAGRRDREK